MFTHVVLMKFGVTEDAAEAKTRLEALAAEIVELQSLAVGLDVAHTPASYDLSLTTTHDSLASYRAYQDHPAHRQFVAWLQPRLTDRVLVDYES